MSPMILEKLDHLLPLNSFDLTALLVAFFNGFDLALELSDLCFELRLFCFLLLDPLLYFSLAVIGLELFPHRECCGVLIESLVCCDCHFDSPRSLLRL